MANLKINFQVNDQLDGFLVRAITELSDFNLMAIQLEHIKSGARILHLYTDDDENLFSINFPTPPPNNTGVPHIMEHAVLSGSRKFPVRDPFFEMVKMSMATFINAMTGWDCTYYPVASNVKQDLFNLAEVYFDAVFYPLLTEQTFKREAHHIVPIDKNNPTGELTINGVVYNEMKGSFSDPESKLYREMSRALFPDSVYGRESGGDPDSIPDLTYQDFKRFHENYYHPSNAYLLLYGDIPTEDYLEVLKDKLNAFERLDIKSVITNQPRWDQPKKIADFYPIGKDESSAEKTYIMINWLVGQGTDAVDVASLYLLSNILFGNEAAPLKKAIIESKLGQDLIYSGFKSVGLETVFRAGLKGSQPDRVDDFESLVLKTLTELAGADISKDRVQAAFQQAAYYYREILPSHPLHIMDRVMDAWIYGADPLTYVRMSEHLMTCRNQYESDAKLFNKLIQERLLENNHRLTFMLKPDKQWQARNDAAFARRMKKLRTQFTDVQLKKIAEEAAELERISGTPNPAEALATLPQLQVKDLPRKPKHIPTTIEKLNGGVDFLVNDVFSNGVNYLYLDFNLKGLPKDLWQFLPRYTDAIHKLGAAGMNYEQIASRVSAYTGGISCYPYFTTHAIEPERSVWGLRFSLKTLDEQIEPALSLLHDLIFGIDPSDRDRLKDVLIQANARYRTELVHDGSVTASRHASRGFTPEGYLYENVNGLPQLALTEKLKSSFDELNIDLMNKIEVIRDFILVPGRLTVSFTGTDHVEAIVYKTLSEWISKMKQESIKEALVDFIPFAKPPREGLAGPMQVAFCSQVIPAPHTSHPDSMLLKLGVRIISLDYLLNEIRFKGNAYGAWCNYSGLDREVEFGSYRDPHVVRTLDVFAGVLDYVRKSDWTQTDVDRAIIGTAKNYEKPIRPMDATKNALHRHLTGQTPEHREQRFEQLLSATVKEVKRAMLELLDTYFEKSAVCVVSSREKLAEANRQMPDQPLTIEDIL
ncbi:MAG: insulinase family protein [bacterium]|nr:MAG: insulinase family protein [bacterium]